MSIILTDGDKMTAAWRKVEEHLNARLIVLRGQLESDVDERISTRLRGQIAEVKSLLDLGKERPVID